MKLNRSDRKSFVAASSIVAFTAGALLLAGCSSSDTSSAASSVDSTATTAATSPASQAAQADAAAGSPSDPCTLLSADAVAQAYSIDKVTSNAKAPQKASNGLTTYMCEYHNAATDSSLGALAISPTDPSVTPEQVIAAWQNLPGAKPVSGVGDAAVYTGQGQGSILGAAKHTSEATVAVMYTGPKAAQDKLAVLVRTAIDGL
ncbi:DUF3558 family protein [Amycolatopsis sp. NPDC051372]|uniref:DUF3558 family protein n=1 Tax=Amycolatopsis sp. NPDC051372 TaxID=3155669 RepID=UPI00343A84C2